MIEVRDGHCEGRSEHQPRRDVSGHLVHGARGVEVARTQGLDDGRYVEIAGMIVDVGVSEIQTHCVASMLFDQRQQPVFDFGIGLVPSDLDMQAVALDERSAQAVGIGVEFGQGNPLRTQEATAQYMLPVAPNPPDALSLHEKLEPAGSLAKRTRAMQDSLSDFTGRIRHPDQILAAFHPTSNRGSTYGTPWRILAFIAWVRLERRPLQSRPLIEEARFQGRERRSGFVRSKASSAPNTTPGARSTSSAGPNSGDCFTSDIRVDYGRPESCMIDREALSRRVAETPLGTD